MHADFERYPDNQWSGKLPPLFRELDTRARAEVGAAPWFVLPSGAFVKLQILEDGRRRLQIARTEKPKDPVEGPRAFAREIDTFVEYFNVTHWMREMDPAAKGVRCLITEPAPIPPHCGNCAGHKDAIARVAGSLICTDCAVVAKQRGMVPCDRCGKLVRKEPAYDIHHCQGCATAAGREYAAMRARERAEASP
jgi:hypothetical protein